MSGLVDPLLYHSSFRVLCTLFTVMDLEKMPVWTFIFPIFVMVIGVVAGILFFITVVHSILIMDVPLFTESGTYFILMVYKLIILSSTKTDLKRYYNLYKAMREDFKYICTDGSVYREKYFENHLLTFRACILGGIFTSIIGGGIGFFATIALFLYFIHRDPSDPEPEMKPLAFPFWLFDLDIDSSPIYETLFILSYMIIVSHVTTYIFMMNSQMTWARQVTCKADVIMWSIQDLLVDIHPATSKAEEEYFAYLLRTRMRHIIQMHQSMFLLLEDYAAVFKKILIYEQTFAAPVICLTAYCIAERLDQGEFDGISTLLCTSLVVLAFIPCYLCTFTAAKNLWDISVIERLTSRLCKRTVEQPPAIRSDDIQKVACMKVQSIGDACWSIPFWNAGPVLRPYLVLIMQRSRRPPPMQAAGFKDFSLETFSSTMTTAYSCFNMLRQSKMDI